MQDDSTLVVGAEREREGALVRVFSKRDAPFIAGGLVLAQVK